ncbi:OmpA family protein [Pantoea sp. EA-12]|uniref:OmpA family protein n=1 Tax=Pantoea sp. EA-12 TaxID=3043303 RepID=UPI0024B52F2C|nr:OmpA family protein [Pantoea sp. EA-12]MDI9220490.1 OmpA family protein [Pantoea sp. EA-12]
MSILLKRTLWLMSCLAALIICVVFLPVSRSAAWAGAVAAVLVAAVAWWRTGRAAQALRHAPLGEQLVAALPDVDYRLPVVLTVGERAEALFAGEAVRETAQGCYILIPQPDQLAHYSEMLLAIRPGWSTQLSALLVLQPEQHHDQPVLAAQLREFRFQVQRCAQHSGHALSAMLACLLQGAPSPWFSVETAQAGVRVWDEQQQGTPLSRWVANADDSKKASRLAQGVMLSSQIAWLREQVLPQFSGTEQASAPLHLHAMAMSWQPEVASVPRNLWQQWLQQRTTLRALATDTVSSHGRFPDFLLAQLPVRRGYSPPQRAAVYALALVTLFSVIALACSSWNNHRLLRAIASDVARYRAIAMTNTAVKVPALNQLQSDARLLEKYQRNGAPVHLALGLYPGEQLYPPVMAEIRGYVPPAKPPEKGVPRLVRLDSMSLFEVGKSALKTGSTKVLVDALIDIKAKPGWMVLVTGHTDSTGDTRANQQLSLARAAAVRDWMIATSDIPETCFAIQGYGATRPVATNTTSAGRAANRRVEISLVPNAAACQPAARQSDLSLSSPSGDKNP